MNYYILRSRSTEKGESGEQCGSKYDLQAACKAGGTGAKLRRKLFTKGLTKVKDNLFSTLNVDLLISSDIFSLFERDGIGLDTVSEVSDYRGNPLPFYHLNPRHSFPKMLPQSEGLIVENQCPRCRQNGYFNDAVIGNLEKNIRTFVKPFSFHYPHIDSKEGI